MIRHPFKGRPPHYISPLSVIMGGKSSAIASKFSALESNRLSKIVELKRTSSPARRKELKSLLDDIAEVQLLMVAP